jgi:RimJ/RimL family protein N-acetyltransferase
MILLQTPRLMLRRFSLSDADLLFELDNDPEVMRYINGGISTPRDLYMHTVLPTFLQHDAARPAFGFWAAMERGSGEFVGWFSLREVDSQNATLGYRLKRAAWGRGYATEGVRALIDMAFAELGIVRLSATTYEENIGSQRVMEKVGMRLVRRFRLTPADLQNVDTFHADADDMWDGDDLEYLLTRAEWAA